MINWTTVRLIGANIRQHTAQVYAGHGREVGLAVARRSVWEIGDYVRDAHGPEIAARMLYSAGDAVISNLPIDYMPGGDPEPAAAPADEPVIFTRENTSPEIKGLQDATNNRAAKITRGIYIGFLVLIIFLAGYSSGASYG